MNNKIVPVVKSRHGDIVLEASIPDHCTASITRTEGDVQGVFYLDAAWESESESSPEPAELSMTLGLPLREFNVLWNPSVRFNKGFGVDWEKGFRSEAASWAPVICLYGYNGVNSLTMALDDARRTILIDAGVNEETACYTCVFRIPRDGSGLRTLNLRLRLDERPIPYHQCLQDVSRWWEGFYPPLQTPEAAKVPLLSTWYSFHLGLDESSILEECEQGRELGFGGIIIDDGWQTEETDRTYAHCGEWRPAPSKIPDMRRLVDKIHALGLTCALWYALPYIGENTRSYSRWKNRVLTIQPPYPAWHVLDPRYPEVREHIITTYERALDNWNLDGFKLDFLDRFARASARENPVRPGMDIPSIPAAADTLLTALAARLTRLNPDLMLECRQTYIGPLSRRWGNVFRAEDCPNSSLTNRVSLLDIRLLCGRTAAHADPLMWNPGESPESAAMQFTNSLFSVPQVSVRLASLPPEHKEMLRFQLAFYTAHRRTLLEGSIEPNAPEGLYDQVVMRGLNERNEEEEIIVCYNRNVVEPGAGRPVIVVNAGRSTEIIWKTPEGDPPRDYRLTDCRGRPLGGGRIPGGTAILPVPPASVLETEIRRERGY